MPDIRFNRGNVAFKTAKSGPVAIGGRIAHQIRLQNHLITACHRPFHKCTLASRARAGNQHHFMPSGVQSLATQKGIFLSPSHNESRDDVYNLQIVNSGIEGLRLQLLRIFVANPHQAEARSRHTRTNIRTPTGLDGSCDLGRLHAPSADIQQRANHISNHMI